MRHLGLAVVAIWWTALAASCALVERHIGAQIECEGGTCECTAGYADCDVRADNGCEISVSDDAEHCGACGNVCANGSCRAGSCECDPEFVDCDGDPTNGCEAELGRDGENCGACGLSCRGGACVDAECGPFEVSGHSDYPTVVADDEWVVWAARDELWVMPSDISGSPTLFEERPDWIDALALHDGEVFWESLGTLYARRMDEADARPLHSLAPGMYFGYLSVTAEHIYWFAADGSVFRIPRGGSSYAELVATQTSGVHASDKFAYYHQAGSLWQVPAEGAATEFATGGAVLAALHDELVVLYDYVGARNRLIIRHEVEQSPYIVNTQVYEDFDFPLWMGADDLGLYFAADGGLLRTPVAPYEPTVLLEAFAPQQVALGNGFMFWGENNKVMGLAK